MRASFAWTTGKVGFLYFSGIVLGVNLLLLGQAMVGDASVSGTPLGVLVSVMLPVLPVVTAYKEGRVPESAGRASPMAPSKP
jgi:hypothetical protein